MGTLYFACLLFSYDSAITALFVLVEIGLLLALISVLRKLPAISGKYIVRKVVNTLPQKRGELLFSNGVVQLKGAWAINVFLLSDLSIIEAYSETSPGLEEYCCIDASFKNGKKILFDGQKKDQQDLINLILVDFLKTDPINWEDAHFSFSSEKQTLYKCPTL